jgi:DNA-binding MarR family transcriptional regulator
MKKKSGLLHMPPEYRANEARCLILDTLIRDEDSGFNEILKGSGLSPTTVSKKLRELIREGYVTRLDSGRYRITGKGIEYFSHIKNQMWKEPKGAGKQLVIPLSLGTNSSGMITVNLIEGNYSTQMWEDQIREAVTSTSGNPINTVLKVIPQRFIVDFKTEQYYRR